LQQEFSAQIKGCLLSGFRKEEKVPP